MECFKRRFPDREKIDENYLNGLFDRIRGDISLIGTSTTTNVNNNNQTTTTETTTTNVN